MTTMTQKQLRELIKLLDRFAADPLIAKEQPLAANMISVLSRCINWYMED